MEETAQQGEEVTFENPNATEGEATVDGPSWYYSAPGEDIEGVAGNGDAPDWFMGDKYKSVEEQAKGYNALYSEYRSKVGEFVGAPEDGYNLDFINEGELGLDTESGAFQGVLELGKELNLSQDGMQKLVEGYVQNETAAMEVKIQEEMTKLGENGKYRLENLQDWGKANLSEEEMTTFGEMFQTADQVKLFESMINKTKPNVAPQETKATNTVNPEKINELRIATDDRGNRKMSVDPEYRAYVLKEEAKLLA